MKQLRFIKFLYIYERTLSDASGKLFGVALIFLILFCTYGMAGYLVRIVMLQFYIEL
jgi:uncharacterized membrane protein